MFHSLWSERTTLWCFEITAWYACVRACVCVTLDMLQHHVELVLWLVFVSHSSSVLLLMLNIKMSLSVSQLEAELALCEREGAELQEYANQVLQQIADRCPDILEQVVNALEDSCWYTSYTHHTHISNTENHTNTEHVHRSVQHAKTLPAPIIPSYTNQISVAHVDEEDFIYHCSPHFCFSSLAIIMTEQRQQLLLSFGMSFNWK